MSFYEPNMKLTVDNAIIFFYNYTLNIQYNEHNEAATLRQLPMFN